MFDNLQRLALCLTTLLIVSCSESEFEDLQTYVNEVKARNPGSIQPLPSFEMMEGYQYSAGIKKDPFLPSFGDEPTKAAGTGVGPDLGRKKQPLEAYPLDGLKLMGSMRKDAGFWAIIQDPSGQLVRVKQGDYMGQNFGKIIRISENSVELRELIADGLGGWEERMTSMSLSE